MNKTKEDVENQEELSDTERTLNTGIDIETKGLGHIQIKELSFETLITLGRDAASIFEKMDFKDSDMDGVGWILSALSEPDAQHAMRKALAASSGKSVDDFEGLGIKDWLLMISALKKVHDWEEIKELFSQLAPTIVPAPAESLPAKPRKRPRGRPTKR
jgi:hypothetical protein